MTTIDMTPIDFFDGTDFDFLSNFHPCTVEYDSYIWPTTEHAFQAMKTFNVEHRYRIRNARGPGHAKMLGQRSAFEHHKITMRPNWDTVKFDVMIDLLRLKFAQPAFKEQLLATGQRPLIEGNTWNDTCWGVCGGIGDNNLGRSLMLVRAEAAAGWL